MQFSEFKEIILGLFPDITPGQLSKYEAMEALYDEWNSKINVISRKDIGGLYPHHVLHSLAIADYLKTQRPETYAKWAEGGLEVLDLGTGGGFPGIPLAVLFPKVNFTLCDSVGKKTIVAGGVSQALELKNVTVVNARAESLGKTFDFVVSRAVTSLDNFYPWVKGRYRDSILHLKGGDVAEETAVMMARNHLAKGSVYTFPIDSWLPDLDFTGKYVIDIRK